MNIDNQILQAVKDKFLSRFPGFIRFAENEKFAEWERDYKVELLDYYRETVLPILGSFPETRQSQAELGDKIISLFTHPLKGSSNKPQNLVGWRYLDFTKKLDEAGKAHFAQLVHMLTDDSLAFNTRLTDFVKGLSDLHQSVGMKLNDAATRSLTTFFLFLHDPSAHIFIKTQEINRALKLLTGQALPSGPLTPESYSAIQKVAQQLFAELQQAGWEPRDLIDVQSFLWTVARTWDEKSGEVYRIELTDGAIKNGYVGAGKPDVFFPARYFGGTTDEQAGDRFTLNFDDGTSIETDIRQDGNASRIRARFSRIFNQLKPKPGDSVEILKQDKDIYQFKLKKTDAPEQVSREEKALEALHPQNLILYGPPGTGKTYQTTQVAVEICDGKPLEDRDELLERFEELRKDGRIQFVTFHQSFGYEDFIEGIRPIMTTIEETGAEQVTYRVQNGILKRICQLAKESLTQKIRTASKLDGLEHRKFAKMSVGGLYDPDVEKYCFEHGYIALGWAADTDFANLSKEKKWIPARDMIKQAMQASDSDDAGKRFATQAIYFFKNWLDVGDVVIVPRGLSLVQAIGVVEGEYEYRPDQLIGYTHFRKVRWLLRDAEIPVEKLQDKQFSQQSIYTLNREDLKLDYLGRLLTDDTPTNQAPESYVLIIDEINRGNISKIFGELITLLEPSKRLGAEDEVILKLPYSGEAFSVPPNLHVLGTMNTADRSIALLDTALRRRFRFIEMPPVASFIPGVSNGTIPDNEGGSIDLRRLLDAINARIEYLLGPDQMLGHAYFINITSFAELEDVFRGQIIPLLQEYFHEDWTQIQMVLSDAFIATANHDPNDLFSHVEGWNSVISNEQRRYRIPGAFSPAMFRHLYNG